MNEPEREWDRLIDSALANYSVGEPLEGIEERVLEKIGMAVRPRRRWPWWVAAATLAAGVLVCSFVWQRPVLKVPEPQTVALVPKASAPLEATVPQSVPRKVEARQTRVTAPRHPRRAQFPSPSPLTQEERAMLTLAKQYPEAAMSMLEWQKTAEREVMIEQIHIAPLEGGSDQ